MRAGVARLGERVLDERDVRLVGFGDAELGLRDDVDAERREQPAEFAQLARVAGGEDEARDHRVTTRCSAQRAQRRLLRRDQLADAALGEVDQRVHLARA